MNLSNPHLEEWIVLLKEHFARRRLLQPGDMYKLMFQGILGPEHWVGSPTAFAELLQEEYDQLTPSLEDPLLEAVHPQHALLRINLKPFKAAGLDLDSLRDACLQTAAQTWGTQQELRTLWESFAGYYHQRQFAAFSDSEIAEFTDWLASHGYPAVHHSPIYRQAYLPAYRLVAADLTRLWSGTRSLQD